MLSLHLIIFNKMKDGVKFEQRYFPVIRISEDGSYRDVNSGIKFISEYDPFLGKHEIFAMPESQEEIDFCAKQRWKYRQ